IGPLRVEEGLRPRNPALSRGPAVRRRVGGRHKPTQLSVNLNAVALLRNRRDLPWPSVTGIGKLALEAGAHGLTVHPRPDERHIRRADVPELAELIRREFPGREFNIEGNPDARFIELCEAVKPDQATLVPDDIRQATSD